jgi:hypothetical protein
MASSTSLSSVVLAELSKYILCTFVTFIVNGRKVQKKTPDCHSFLGGKTATGLYLPNSIEEVI